MAAIDISLFGGCVKKTSPLLIQKHESVDARNLYLESGRFEPLADNVDIGETVPDDTQSIYLFNDNQWLHWTHDVNVAKGAIAADTTERTYFTHENTYPRVGDVSTIGSDVYYRLGIPAPENAPTLTVNGTGTEEPESRSYVYTFVSAWGEEGAPSPASAIADVYSGQTVTVTTEAPPTGDYNFSLKRYYRTVTTASGTYWMYVGEGPVASTSFTDNKTTTELGEVLQTGDWDMPPEDMHGLISLPNGLMAGFSKNEVCFCVPYQPHAWPVAYRYAVDEDIVAIGAVGQDVIVTTKENPYIISGIDPAGMTKSKIPMNQSCVSKRSLVSMGFGVMYASPDGLVLVGGPEGASMVTKNVLSREQWQALKPESILGACHDNKYYGFYDTGTQQGGFIVYPDGVFEFLDYHAMAAYNDLLTDALYVVEPWRIRQVEGGGSTKLTGSWTSKEFLLSIPINMSCVWSSDACTISVYGDDIMVFSGTVQANEMRWLSAGYLANKWQVKISGSVPVNQVILAETVEEIMAAM